MARFRRDAPDLDGRGEHGLRLWEVTSVDRDPVIGARAHGGIEEHRIHSLDEVTELGRDITGSFDVIHWIGVLFGLGDELAVELFTLLSGDGRRRLADRGIVRTHLLDERRVVAARRRVGVADKARRQFKLDIAQAMTGGQKIIRAGDLFRWVHSEAGYELVGVRAGLDVGGSVLVDGGYFKGLQAEAGGVGVARQRKEQTNHDQENKGKCKEPGLPNSSYAKLVAGYLRFTWLASSCGWMHTVYDKV